MVATAPAMTPKAWSTKSSLVHVTKVKCERSGRGDRRFRLYGTVITGKLEGKELTVPMPEREAETTFKLWTDLTVMPTDQEYIFPVDDQPRATIVYRNNEPNHASDVQADFGHRAIVCSDLLTAAKVPLDYHFYNNRKSGFDLREKIIRFDTTADAVRFTIEYIKEHSKPMTDQADAPVKELEDLKDAGKKLTSELDTTFPRPKREHTTSVPKDMVFAVPNFLECELNLNKETKEKNKVAMQVYGHELTEEYITEQTPAAIWIKAEDFVDQYKDVYLNPAEPPTKEQWKAWLNANQLDDKEVLELLNADSIQRNEGPVKKFSEWDLGIEDADKLVKTYLASKSNEKATTSPDNEKSAPTTPETKQSQQTVPQSPAATGKPVDSPKSGLKIQKAVKRDLRLRLALAGVPGGGKTYTALQIATAMFPEGKIALIDTENRNSLKFADLFNFDYIDIGAPYTPERYIEGIQLAESEGYNILIIDSLTHAWKEEGGILSWVDQAKANPKYQTQGGKENTQAIWAEATPRHNAMVSAVLNSKIHIIATLRAKYREVPIRDTNRQIIGTRKIITDYVQRDGLPYEFDIVAKLQDPDIARIDIDKTRCPALSGFSKEKAGVAVARILTEWLKDDPRLALATAS